MEKIKIKNYKLNSIKNLEVSDDKKPLLIYSVPKHVDSSKFSTLFMNNNKPIEVGQLKFISDFEIELDYNEDIEYSEYLKSYILDEQTLKKFYFIDNKYILFIIDLKLNNEIFQINKNLSELKR